ncbi:MAG: hypothetical protein M0P01_09875 [Treponema sp.]|nr:hypothetical protein [Treponema sp.]
MRKYLFFILLTLAAFTEASAESLYDEFLGIYDAYASDDKTFYALQKLNEYDSNGKLVSETDADCLIYGNNEMTRINKKGQDLYFLSTASGYWIKNDKLQQPLKISGSYKVMEIQMQDLLRIDFRNDFCIDNGDAESGNTILLKRTNRKNTYSYIRLNKKSGQYRAEMLDAKKQKLKTLIYETGEINGITCFSSVSITDDVFSTGAYYKYITVSMKSIKVSKVLFNPVFMDELIRFFEKKS